MTWALINPKKTETWIKPLSLELRNTLQITEIEVIFVLSISGLWVVNRVLLSWSYSWKVLILHLPFCFHLKSRKRKMRTVVRFFFRTLDKETLEGSFNQALPRSHQDLISHYTYEHYVGEFYGTFITYLQKVQLFKNR